jgi:hypothetical protein
MSAGPRATSTFLLLTALLFGVLLGAIAWRSNAAGAATWLLAAGIAVAVLTVGLGVMFARGVGQGRL